MHQYLVGQGYWSYVEGVHTDQPIKTAPQYATWVQAASRVMYCLATCVHDHMLCYICDAKGGVGKSTKDFRGKHNHKEA